MRPLPNIKLSDYQYNLPDDRIAKYPLTPRDASKLLVFQNGQIGHRTFTDLPNALPDGSFLVFNDTKVIPARLFFQRSTGATIEVFLLHPEAPSRVISEAMQAQRTCTWQCMIGHKKRWKPNEMLSCHLQINDLTVTLNAQLIDHQHNWVQLSWDADLPFVDIVQAAGQIPLPPYLNRHTEDQDKTTYQTVYSKIEGAVAAPTAGLHFTDRVFGQLRARGIGHDFVTLHVGAGTFQPVKAQNAIEHPMHAEQVVYSKDLVVSALAQIENLIAVGTTSMRALESLYWFGVKLLREAPTDGVHFVEQLYPYQFEEDDLPAPRAALTAVLAHLETTNQPEFVGETSIMIVPSYGFKLCRGLITNYHQPNSTLLMLIAALVGDAWHAIYAQAMQNDYRFLSYGDSSLLLPEPS